MQTGKRTIEGCLQCTAVQTQSSDDWRCAIVVPVTTNKRAVVRNRMKRLISEAIRHMSITFPAGLDIVFFVKKGFVYETQQQANDQVYSLLRKAGFSIES